MISPTILALAIALILGGLSTLEAIGWRGEIGRSPSYSRPAAGLAAILIPLYLIWLAIDRQHLPPAASDEVLAAYAWLLLLFYLRLRPAGRVIPGVLKLGLIGLTIVFVVGLILAWQGAIHVGPEPWWVGVVTARWIILGGLAGLYWLMLQAALSLWCEAARKPHLSEGLLLPDEQIALFNRRLQPLVTLLFFCGGLILSLSAVFSTGDAANPGLVVLALFLLSLAVAWLRFTTPYRRWWAWALTIFTFVLSLPLFTMMVA